MRKIVLSAALALCAIFGMQTTAQAENVITGGVVERPSAGLTMTSKCGTDVMFVYDLPRDRKNRIVFARSYDWDRGEQIDETKQMTTSGSNVCLPAGTGNVHRLRLGDGVEVDFPTQAAVTKFVRWAEAEALDESMRVMDAYGIKYASN